LTFSERIRTSRNRADVIGGDRAWFKFENKGDSTDIQLYNEIGFFGVTAQEFVAELRNVSTRSIDLHVNSPGGDVFDGIAIHNALKQHPAKVNVIVDGIAASIASVIAMAGDSIRMAGGSLMMIHEPFAMVIGDATDMRKSAEALDVMGDSIAGIYAQRAGGEVEAWRAVMREETWYSAEAAMKAGLADEVFDSLPAKNTFDLSIFRNAPKPVVPDPEPVPVPDWRRSAQLQVAAALLEV